MTSETLKNPSIQTIPNPVGLDRALRQTQGYLAALPWLQKVFGRAWTRPRYNGAEKTIEPMAYQGSKEYYPCLPNDSLRAYSFFRSNKGRATDEYEPGVNYGNFFFTEQVDLICWYNMEQIDNTKDYPFGEILLRDVFNALNNDLNVKVLRVWDDKVEDIFSGYTLYPHHRDLLMYPYGAFRLELELKYLYTCVEDGTPPSEGIFDYTFDDSFE